MAPRETFAHADREDGTATQGIAFPLAVSVALLVAIDLSGSPSAELGALSLRLTSAPVGIADQVGIVGVGS